MMILLKIGCNICSQPAKCSNYANNFGIGMYAKYNACNTRIASDGKHQFLGRDIVLSCLVVVVVFFDKFLNLISPVVFTRCFHLEFYGFLFFASIFASRLFVIVFLFHFSGI